MNQDVPCHRGMHIRSSMDQWVMVARDLTNLVWCIWLFSVYRHWVQCRVSKIGAPRLLFRLQCGKPNKPTMTDALNRPQAICGHDLATLRWWVSHIGFCILTILRLAVVPCRPRIHAVAELFATVDAMAWRQHGEKVELQNQGPLLLGNQT